MAPMIKKHPWATKGREKTYMMENDKRKFTGEPKWKDQFLLKRFETW